MQNFMKDRYGVDALTYVLALLGLILSLIASLLDLGILTWISIAIIVFALYRAFSKNTAARSNENEKFCDFAEKVPGLNKLVAYLGGATASGSDYSYAASAASYERQAQRSRKKAEREREQRIRKLKRENKDTTKYLKCPSCGQTLAVPKGKGKIRVTCPKCGNKIETKS